MLCIAQLFTSEASRGCSDSLAVGSFIFLLWKSVELAQGSERSCNLFCVLVCVDED